MKNNLPPFIEIYRALIATPSISATEEALDQSNESLINLLAGWFRDLGFNVEIQPVPDTRHKFNLLASTGHGAGGLLLAGHTDTVPFDDGRWTRDPFTLTEHDNKLYGLGTADMKGFFAFILDALRDVDVTTLKKPLYILATADEETSMAGARYFAETTRLRPDCAIIGEPTSLQPIRAHKGHMSNAIRIQGQSGHSSDPARGVNAIELMHDAIGRIMQLRDLLKERYHFEAFTVPYPTLNLGAIHGGDASNRICACCELQGKVDFLDNQLTPSTGTIRMRALLDNSQRLFTPGLFARVRLPGSAEFKATLIDDKAVLTDQDRKYVYIVDKDGKAQRRDITPGRLADGLRIVQKGLNPGDSVIVDGLQKVFMPGMPVNAKTVAMTSSATLN